MEISKKRKFGRGRIYRITGRYPSLEKFGATLEYLDELRLRLSDLLEDISPELGNRTPDWSANSIFYLGAHMIWAEQHWIEEAINGQYQVQKVLDLKPLPGIQIEKKLLLTALDVIGKKITTMYVEKIEHEESVFTQTGPFNELGELLQHLCWHYSYHAGQVGLLRRYVGMPYQWNFE